MRILRTPITESTVRDLELGEVVYITGKIITGRDEMHMRAIEHPDKASDNICGAVIFHCGPIIQGSDVIAAGPTTSARMNSTAPEVIRRYGVRAIIGKGGMSRDVSKVMKETGCVYLAATGGAAVSLAEGLSVEGIEWKDLGMAEAMWILKAKEFGPLIVAMDSKGNSLYDDVMTSLKK